MTAATTSRGRTGDAGGPVDPVGTDLMRTLRALKLGQMADTLPERLTLARTRSMGHGAFLELVLNDEVTRRESRSAMLRARTAGLDPTMRLDTWRNRQTCNTTGPCSLTWPPCDSPRTATGLAAFRRGCDLFMLLVTRLG
jgi:hypothetical protein